MGPLNALVRQCGSRTFNLSSSSVATVAPSSLTTGIRARLGDTAMGLVGTSIAADPTRWKLRPRTVSDTARRTVSQRDNSAALVYNHHVTTTSLLRSRIHTSITSAKHDCHTQKVKFDFRSTAVTPCAWSPPTCWQYPDSGLGAHNIWLKL